MTKEEALKLALEALVLNNAEWKHLADSGDSGDWSAEDQDHYKHTEEAITAIKEALAQPEQEPVGWAEHGVINWLADKQFNHTSFLYATPPQRTWVGLTDEEIDQGLLRSDYAFKTAEAWRAGVVFAMTKLKEKNI